MRVRHLETMLGSNADPPLVSVSNIRLFIAGLPEMKENTRQIMVLRHAKAEADSINGDYARALTAAGKQHARQLGQHILDLKLIPQSIYCSAARRAQETADLVCEQLFIAPGQVALREQLYQADNRVFLDLLRGLNPRISRVMLVGHNPALEDLVDCLCKDAFESNQAGGKRLLPASLIILEYDGDWAALGPESCRIVQMIHGKQLRPALK